MVCQIDLAFRFGILIRQNEFNLTIRQFNLAKRIQFDDSAIRLDISIWHFDLAYRYGNSIWHFDSAKRVQFDDPAIRFGNSIWQNKFILTIRQFD
jgi:hypothetical protein